MRIAAGAGLVVVALIGAARRAGERRAVASWCRRPDRRAVPLRAATDLAPPRPEQRIHWRESKAIGLPYAGRLVRGVQLPAEGRTYFTWDPIRETTPNRGWRRWGTDRLIRTTLRVARRYRRENPGAPRLTIGDLSRPRGGDFGPQYGEIGHASHQNGLDIDIYYPRRDRRERAPTQAEPGRPPALAEARRHVRGGRARRRCSSARASTCTGRSAW